MAGKKVVAAMSGGVDSSLTAALLLERGYDVTGVNMRVAPGTGEPSKTDAAVEDARSVAKMLGIPFHVVNFQSLFKERVIDNFVEEYLTGRTPNPCAVCNRRVKFGALLEKAMELGADYLATGHYARLFFDGQVGRYAIRKAVDRRKDQTYFLYTMRQDQISRSLMPLGEFTKDRVRQMAEERGIKTARKAESQEICFIPGDDYHSFVSERAGDRIKPGPFLDLEGNVLGQHKGIAFYTIGQRRGLGLALGERIYVVDIDPARNAVVVGPREALDCYELEAEKNNFILWDGLEEEAEAEVQIRYNSEPLPAVLVPEKDKIKVRFSQPPRAVAPGQSAVYYRGDYLLGGGVIARRTG